MPAKLGELVGADVGHLLLVDAGIVSGGCSERLDDLANEVTLSLLCLAFPARSPQLRLGNPAAAKLREWTHEAGSKLLASLDEPEGTRPREPWVEGIVPEASYHAGYQRILIGEVVVDGPNGHTARGCD